MMNNDIEKLFKQASGYIEVDRMVIASRTLMTLTLINLLV